MPSMVTTVAFWVRQLSTTDWQVDGEGIGGQAGGGSGSRSGGHRPEAAGINGGVLFMAATDGADGNEGSGQDKSPAKWVLNQVHILLLLVIKSKNQG